WLARCEEVPAHRVSAEALDHLPGIDDVPKRLGHLASLLVNEQSVADHVAVRGAVEQQSRNSQQRVEPAARLVKPLAYEIGRESPLEVFGTGLGSVVLGE